MEMETATQHANSRRQQFRERADAPEESLQRAHGRP
jgi:hypothetical protein